jgi:cobalt-zinc-cadmium efflux system outer membrane protein
MSRLQCFGAAIIAINLLAPPASAEGSEHRGLTLDQALQEALAHSPVLRAHQAGVEQARARVVAARTYPFNPEIEISLADREGLDGSSSDRGIELGQEIELGGKRRRRVEQAEAGLAAAEARLRRDERLLRARVGAAFVEALRARALVEVEEANAALARTLAEVARKRLDAGAATQIEVNLALAQMGRDERTLYLAASAYSQARSFLAGTIGLDPADPPEPLGDLEAPIAGLPPLTELVGLALERREDLESLRQTLTAAQAQRQAAKRETVPNLHLGAFYEKEEGTDRIVGASVGFSLPIFNRNRGAIAEAEALQRQAEAEEEAAEIEVRREVASARSRYRAAASSVQGFKQVIGNLRENLDLLQRSLEAGKIGWADVLLFRREFADAQRDYVETLADARFAGIELELASGGEFSASREEGKQ